ncbi:VCBS repeat-containing protein [Clostridium sp. MSJ-11]|uniref:VCBS repeat-containing protein n=1 Tax=Clostridium mobile TaxID=2841512 RepID=A0ABS6EHJ4_9CLOT|nr:VCBS repeat-containing protein [Clostridium mobile]MBU5484684.1 VCBS repeat-containing protein [Clostridium mobile]
MFYCPWAHLNREMAEGRYRIIQYKKGDVNGDKIADGVYLIGKKPFGEESPFYDHITLVIRDGKDNRLYYIELEDNSGYDPTIFLGDFTGDGINDIFITINSGGSGGFTYNYLYSFVGNQPRKLFDYEDFNKSYEYEVTYKDNYKVEVLSKTLNKQFIIDISNKPQDYLNEIYDKNGKLIKEIKGDVIGVGNIYPIDFDGDGVYELFALQRIIGRFNADTLGLVQTSLKWDGNKFIPFNQYVGIFGATIALI